MADYSQQADYSEIERAAQAGLIENGHDWMEALENRNKTTHTYDELLSKE